MLLIGLRKQIFSMSKEIDYMGGVYNKLFDKSVQNLDDLLMVITANQTTDE